MGRNDFFRRVKQTRLFTHAGLLIILGLFVILATLHSLVVPIAQGEDELAHYRYISFIAQTGRLPINAAEREQAWYRSDWPPLYHLLVGWAISPLDTTRPHLKDVGESPRRRLVGEIVYPRLIIYTEDMNWPWQDGILAWHIGRFISILFSTIALVFTYLTALEFCQAAKNRTDGSVPIIWQFGSADCNLHSSQPKIWGTPKTDWLPCYPATLLPYLTTALLAFTPRYLFTSAMLSDDSLFILLSAIFIWLLLRALRGDDRGGVYAVLGVLLGLSLTTKYSTGLLPLVIIPAVWWRARQANWHWSQALGRLAVSWIGVLVASSWWFGWLGYFFNTTKQDGLLIGLLKPMLNAGPDVSMNRVFAFFTGRDSCRLIWRVVDLSVANLLGRTGDGARPALSLALFGYAGILSIGLDGIVSSLARRQSQNARDTWCVGSHRGAAVPFSDPTLLFNS